MWTKKWTRWRQRSWNLGRIVVVTQKLLSVGVYPPSAKSSLAGTEQQVLSPNMSTCQHACMQPHLFSVWKQNSNKKLLQGRWPRLNATEIRILFGSGDSAFFFCAARTNMCMYTTSIQGLAWAYLSLVGDDYLLTMPSYINICTPCHVLEHLAMQYQAPSQCILS